MKRLFTEDIYLAVQGVENIQLKDILPTLNIKGGLPDEFVSYFDFKLKIPSIKPVKKLSMVPKNKKGVSVIATSPIHFYDALIEGIDKGYDFFVAVTHKVPKRDIIHLKKSLPENIFILGPGSLGFVVPDKINLSIMPASLFKKGDVAVVSTSGSVLCEVVNILTINGIGQSVVMDIGSHKYGFMDLYTAARMAVENTSSKKVIVISDYDEHSLNEIKRIKKDLKEDVFYFAPSCPKELIDDCNSFNILEGLVSKLK